MDQPLEHDPKTKQQIKDALYTFLYAPVTRQFKTRIETLIARNTVMGGYSHKHFVYKGVVYNADVTQPPLKKNRLVAQLRGDMDEYLDDKDKLNNQELPFVLGFINQVLNSSNNITDYLRVLPESLHAPLLQLQATCPCRATCLTEEKVHSLRQGHRNPIDLIKQRLVTNLLL